MHDECFTDPSPAIMSDEEDSPNSNQSSPLPQKRLKISLPQSAEDVLSANLFNASENDKQISN